MPAEKNTIPQHQLFVGASENKLIYQDDVTKEN